MSFNYEYIKNPDLLPIKWWECEDFSYFASENNWLHVIDHAEGTSYGMSMQQIKHALVECLVDECEEFDGESGEPMLSVDGAQWLAEQIMLSATTLGLCCFVKNYKEV